MADHIVGLDFGSRSIKMMVVDNTGDPVVVDYDSEDLALDPDPYLEDPDAKPNASSSGEESSEQEAEAPDEGVEQTDGEAGAEPGGQPSGDDEWEAGFGPSQSWIETLDRLLARHDFEQGTQFVTFLPEGRAISIHQEVPFPEPSKVKSILPNLLEDRLPIAPEHIVYDFELIESDAAADEEAEHTAVVGLGRKRDIRRFLEHLQGSDLNPSALGIPELMLRYVAEATVPRSETAALVDIGHRFTRVIVLEDGEAVLAHSVEVGGWTATRRIAQKFDISLEQAESYKRNRATVRPPAEASDREEEALSETLRAALRPLVRDLRRNFQSLYANQRIELDCIYLCGGTSRIDHLEAYLDERFGVPVDPLPLETAAGYQILEGEGDPETALALACALQPVRDRKQRRLLNLRRGEFAYSGGSGLLEVLTGPWGAVAAALLVLFVGTLLGEKYRLESKAAAMDRAVAQQTKQLFGQSVTDPTVVENLATGKSSGKRAFVPEMSAYELYYELMSRISQEIELELDRIDVDIDRNIVQLSGTTTDPQTVDEIVTDLDELECIGDINKKPVRVQSENEARFELEISSNCS